jgi:hypothetical protein
MISGMVTHVCRHGGQRLFITDTVTGQTVRITTGKDIPEFDISMEGSNIVVNGIVRELVIDETYLAEWEARTEEGTAAEHLGGGTGEHMSAQVTEDEARASEAEGAEEQKLAQMESIRQKREELAASGKDHLSEYWVEAICYELKEN